MRFAINACIELVKCLKYKTLVCGESRSPDKALFCWHRDRGRWSRCLVPVTWPWPGCWVDRAAQTQTGVTLHTQITGGGIVCPRPPSVADWFPQPRIFRNYSENTRDLVPGDGCIIQWSHSPGLVNTLSLPPDDWAPRHPAHTGHMSPWDIRDIRDSWLNLVSCHQDLCHHLTISGPHVTFRLSELIQLHAFYIQSSQIKYKLKLSNLVTCFWCFLGAEGILGWEPPSSGCSLLKCCSEPNIFKIALLCILLSYLQVF